MNDTRTAVEPGEIMLTPPAPSRLVANGEPAGAVIEALLGALRRGEITSKFAREVLVRALPPSKQTVRVAMPKIVDAKSYATAAQRIMAAAASGKIAPADAAILLRNAKATWGAVSAANRSRFAY